jgi:ectoine hydroxylase-related dioxygenase (phytanoyl-CoA dioxygenase family)
MNSTVKWLEADATKQDCITEEQKQFFLDNGFLVIRKVLQGAELKTIQDDMMRLLEAGAAEVKDDPDFLYGNGLKSGKPVLRRINQLMDKSDPMKVLLGNPFILRSVEMTQRRSFIPTHDSMVIKMPDEGIIVPWHRDGVSYYGTDRRPIYNVDFYLDQADEGNCLWVIPGSNRWSWDDSRARCAREGFDTSDAVPVPLEAGDCIFHDINVLHGSPAGNGNKLRRTVYYEFRPGELEVEFGPHNQEFVRLKQQVLVDGIERRKQSEFGKNEVAYSYRPEGLLAMNEIVKPTTYRYEHSQYHRKDSLNRQPKMLVGRDHFTFDMKTNWGKLPEGVKFGFTHGVVTDSQDRVYVHNQSKDAVAVFSPEGDFLTSWGEWMQAGAHGMMIHNESGTEYLYFANPDQGKVWKTTLDGEILLELGVPPFEDVYEDPTKYKPTEVAVAPNGDIYVTDGYGQSWVHHYNAKGEYIRSWGGKGTEAGQLKNPHGIRVDTRGEVPVIYVADRGNQRLQLFTLEGEHIAFVTDQMNRPCGSYDYHDGALIVPDLRSRVTLIDREDRLIVHLGADDAWMKEGWPRRPVEEHKRDRFVSPHAACTNSKGDIFIVEWVPTGRLTKLTKV